ncbi:EthD domain-containing protein [Risungbinella massiliensis]|uniref:hypothetical protein n=1 Tax=Risungbinella massiliensis TaxID=1329796 RepID=UPI0005CBA5B3|nr:hypothetical protein [Risungbinella massiliensis]
MFKTIGIYKGLEDVEKFQRFYVQEVMPRMLDLPGVQQMRITALTNTNPEDQPFDMGDVQFIIETFYDSPESVKQVTMTPEGQELIKILGTYRKNMAAFVGKEHTITARARVYSSPKQSTTQSK